MWHINPGSHLYCYYSVLWTVDHFCHVSNIRMGDKKVFTAIKWNVVNFVTIYTHINKQYSTSHSSDDYTVNWNGQLYNVSIKICA